MDERNSGTSMHSGRGTSLLEEDTDLLCSILRYLDTVELVQCGLVCKFWLEVTQRISWLWGSFSMRQVAQPLEIPSEVILSLIQKGGEHLREIDVYRCPQVTWEMIRECCGPRLRTLKLRSKVLRPQLEEILEQLSGLLGSEPTSPRNLYAWLFNLLYSGWPPIRTPSQPGGVGDDPSVVLHAGVSLPPPDMSPFDSVFHVSDELLSLNAVLNKHQPKFGTLHLFLDLGSTLDSTHLDLDNTIWDSLENLLENPRVTGLNLSGNPLRSIPEVVDTLRSAARWCLMELDLSNTGLTVEQLQQAVALGAPGGTLQILDLASNKIGPSGFKAIVNAVAPLPAGTSEAADPEADADTDPHTCNLRVLNVWGNSIPAPSAKALIEASKRRTHRGLRLCGRLLAQGAAVALKHARLSPGDAMLLANDLALRSGAHGPLPVRTLDLEGSVIGPAGAAALAAALAPAPCGALPAPRLACLNVWNCRVGSECAEALVGSARRRAAAGGPPLRMCGALLAGAAQEVDLSHKRLTCSAALLLAHDLSLLPAHAPLRSLNLWGNSLDLQGAAVVTAAVRELVMRRHLATLARGATGGSAAADPSVEMIKVCGSLLDAEHCDLSHKRLGPGEAVLVAHDLAQNPPCRVLLMSDNDIKSDGAQALVDALCCASVGPAPGQGPAISQATTGEVGGGSGPIGEEGGLEAVAGHRIFNTTLEQLDVCRNGIGDAGAKAFASAIWRSEKDAGEQCVLSPAMRKIDLRSNDWISPNLMKSVHAAVKSMHTSVDGNRASKLQVSV